MTTLLIDSDPLMSRDYLEWLEAWSQQILEAAGDPTQPYQKVREELEDAFESGASLEILFEISEYFKIRPRS